MSEDNQLNGELNPTVPPGGLDTKVCPKRVWRSTSIPRDLTPDSNNREGDDSKSGLDASRGDDEISSWPQREISQIRKNGDQLDPRSLQIERLLGCAYRASIVLNAEGVPFALIPGETTDRFDVASLHSRDFATYLREAYHNQHRHFPKEALLRVVRDLLDRGVSHRNGSSRPVALRVARGKAEHPREPDQPQIFDQILALDLGRSSSAGPDSVLEIDAEGWSVNHSSGFVFIRPRGHRPIPLPEPAGPEALSEFKDLLRVDEHNWPRIITWLLAAIRPTGPYPILVLQGEPGSGKSQAARMLKSLLDPTAGAFQPLPANPNSVLRQAAQTWIQAFDHVTGVPKQISAALCRLSTSAGFNLRIDGSPITISLARPILLTVPTGASGAAWKPTDDLLHRMLTVTLPPSTARTTKPESEIAERFEKARPKILGALAQAVSVAMGRMNQIHLASYPSHPEAAVWTIAASPALNITEESLQQALEQKRQFAMPKDPLLHKIAMLMATRDDWQGTATQLKLELDPSIAPNHLSRKLKEVHAILQDVGIAITFPPRQENGQLIRITKIDRQIVSAEQNKGEPITLPREADHQALRPAADTTASTTELPPASGATETETTEGTIEAASPPCVVTAGATVINISAGPQLECTTAPPSKSPTQSGSQCGN